MPPELLAMRHSKSSWSDGELADLDRPLTARGKRDAEAMGRLLSEKRLDPDLLLTSPARRASSTLKRLVKGGSLGGEVRVEADLYDTSVQQIVRLLSSLPEHAERVLIVAHNPTLEELVHLLTGKVVPMGTSSVACIRLSCATWADVGVEPRGQLHLMLTPPSVGDQCP
jgi:phosphohistidine phosphatase